MSQNDFEVLQNYIKESGKKHNKLQEYVTKRMIEVDGFKVSRKLERILNLVNERSTLTYQLVSLTVLHSKEDIDGNIDRINEIDNELNE
jgi:hypothetical protein